MTPILLFSFYHSYSRCFPQFASVFHIFHFSDFLVFTSFSTNFPFLSIRDVFSLKHPEFYRDRHFIPIAVRIVRDLANSQHFLRCKRDASVEQTPTIFTLCNSRLHEGDSYPPSFLRQPVSTPSFLSSPSRTPSLAISIRAS